MIPRSAAQIALLLTLGCGASAAPASAPAPSGAARASASPAVEPATEPSPLPYDLARLEALVAPHLDAPHRAVGIATIVDGEARFHTFGPRSAKRGGAFGPDTTFEIGSISKVMVGILLADAVGRGEVALDDPLERHLGSGWTVPTFAGRPITLVHAATHHSGLPMMPTNWVPLDPSTNRTRYTEPMLREFLATFALPYAPGERYEYGNVGPALVALALTHRARMPFRDLLNARLLDPLGMSRSGYQDERMRVDDDALDGYDDDDALMPVRTDVSPVGPCCAIRSTLRDMARFAEAVITPPEALRSAFDEAARPHASRDDFASVGLGWEIDERLGLLRKNGEVAGFRTDLVVSTSTRIATFVVINSQKLDVTALSYDVFSAVSGRVEPRALGDHAANVVDALPPEATRAEIDFSGLVRIEGWEAPTRVRPGETVELVVYYRCLAPIDRDYRIFVHGDAETGDAPRLRGDHYPARDTDSTLSWRPGELVRDRVELAIPAGRRPGAFVVWTGFYLGGNRLPLTEQVETTNRDRARGPRIRVVRR